MSARESRFGRPRAEVVLRAACDRVGLSHERAELLRLGENAIFRLAVAPVVVRIGRSLEHWDAARKEVAFSRWLERTQIAGARTWDLLQPIEVDQHPVTFWHFIEGRRGGPGDVSDLASSLRKMHQLPVPDGLDLPVADILARVVPRILRSRIPSSDRQFLSDLLEHLQLDLKRLQFPLTPAVIHGDAHVQNLMYDSDGPVLIDFERVAIGQPEWDLAVTATEYVTAGWWSDEQYAAFVESYGHDIMSWSGFDTLRRVNEIKMTTWLMQNIGESPDVEREYHVRMQTIRGERNDRAWSTF